MEFTTARRARAFAYLNDLFDAYEVDSPFDVLADLEGEGVCLDCGAEAGFVEPDAEGYRCECCGAFGVIGIEALIVSCV